MKNKKIILCLFGFLIAASAEVANIGNLCLFADTNYHQDLCSQSCNVTEQTIEKQRIAITEPNGTSATANALFSLPKIADCDQHHYSLYNDEFECTKLLQSSCEIFFSSDGHQPTAEKAVEWSCANSEDESVTDWYMAMFGLIEWNKDAFLNFGFDSKNKIYQIINFDPELDKDPTKASESQAFKAAFIANFRKIASVSVGRVLLYRILLEIRRTNAEGSGCIDTELGKSLSEKQANNRNELRTITIKNSDRNSFDSGGCIRFHDSRDQKQTNVLNSNGIITKHARTDDVGLFHEMLHWFHSLRDIDRKNKERKVDTEIIDRSLIQMGDENLELWSRKNGKGQYIIKMEEFRTIIGEVVEVKSNGVVVYDTESFIEGDDLSENLYRVCIGQQIRYGHATIPGQSVSEKVANHLQTLYTKTLYIGGYKTIKH